jgi:hypothetical protein
MGLINYKNIDFNKSIDKTNKIINFNGSEIQIVNYLSANDKYDLIMITLQKSFDKNIYNSFKLDVYFDLHIVYMYTNIMFSNEDKLDEMALYDTLKRSGFIDIIKSNIDENELKELKEYIYTLSEVIIKYRNTFGAVVGTFAQQLPENMEKAKELIGEFDPDKYKGLLEIASQIKAGSLV